MYKNKEREIILHNKKRHDIVASSYDAAHIEIYNPTEQKRIEQALQYAISQIRTGVKTPRVLDFGAGTGNLTRHLLNLQADVEAADVSPGSLDQLKLKLGGSERLKTIILNGENLSDIKDDSFDMVATYSVLHHIPDYLKIVDEFVRVIKPGGVIYIDHEASPSYWEINDTYQSYLEELGGDFVRNHLCELGITEDVSVIGRLSSLLPAASWKRLIRMFARIVHELLPAGEGDIHVYKHDHIEWAGIKSKLSPRCDILLESEYLVCRERNDIPRVWEKWKDKCADMRLIIARKRPYRL